MTCSSWYPVLQNVSIATLQLLRPVGPQALANPLVLPGLRTNWNLLRGLIANPLSGKHLQIPAECLWVKAGDVQRRRLPDALDAPSGQNTDIEYQSLRSRGMTYKRQSQFYKKCMTTGLAFSTGRGLLQTPSTCLIACLLSSHRPNC